MALGPSRVVVQPAPTSSRLQCQPVGHAEFIVHLSDRRDIFGRNGGPAKGSPVIGNGAAQRQDLQR
jgi:hypothetical protein